MRFTPSILVSPGSSAELFASEHIASLAFTERHDAEVPNRSAAGHFAAHSARAARPPIVATSSKLKPGFCRETSCWTLPFRSR